MSLILVAILSIIVGWLGYNWYETVAQKRKVRWLPSVPGWPVLGNILEFGKTTDTLETIRRLTSKHGKLILLQFVFNNVIISCDYDFNEFILGSHKVLNKSYFYTFLHKWLGTGLLTADAPVWKDRRRLLTPAFHFSILEQFLETMESNGKIMIHKLKKFVGKDAVDIYEHVTLYALDVICEAAMGVSVNAQINENSDYVRSVKEMSRILAERWISVLKRSKLLFRLHSDYYKEKEALNVLHGFTYSVIDSKIQKLRRGSIVDQSEWEEDMGVKKKMAFLDILLGATVDGVALSREDIREEVDTFMFEGHDTTSSAISFTLYLLAKHPDIQERAVDEQRAIFGDDRDRKAAYADLQEMKYLECIIKESLRIYPSVPSYSRLTHEDVYYKGNLIPKGTNIGIFSFFLMKDPEYFPDPDKFDPSRFEGVGGKRPYSYIPFSAGPRNCIGQRFAMMEIKSIVSQVLKTFVLSPTVPEHQILIAKELILKSKTGIKIRLANRDWLTSGTNDRT